MTPPPPAGTLLPEVSGEGAARSRTSPPHPGASREIDAASPAPSGRRLGQSVLGYLVVATLVVTWAPFSFAWPESWNVDFQVDAVDVVLNVVMFLPFGFLLHGTRLPGWPGGSRGILLAGLCGGALSLMVELGQLFLVERFTSPVDLTTNALGAALGAAAMDRLGDRMRLGPGRVTMLALDLPLTGLLLLLTPLPWLLAFGSAGSERIWLLLPLAAFGGALLGAVHGGYLRPRGGASGKRRLLLGASAAWFLVVALPGGWGRPEVLAGGAALAVGGAWLRSVATERAARLEGERRVEIPTLRMVLPVFALYLALSALWPLDAISGEWAGGWTLAPGSPDLSKAGMMRSLEYLGAFTLVGYMSAEFHGRRGGEGRPDPGPVIGGILFLAILLEGARGWVGGAGASGSLALLAAAAGVSGALIYRLQRAHVLALLGREQAEGGPSRPGVHR
jgi:hypothetical protein